MMWAFLEVDYMPTTKVSQHLTKQRIADTLVTKPDRSEIDVGQVYAFFNEFTQFSMGPT